MTCDELYGLVNTSNGYACVGYQAGNQSKIPDASDPYQPDLLVLEELNSYGDSDAYLYNIENAGSFDPQDICGRDILRVLDDSTEYLVSCGWFIEQTASGLMMRGYIERREVGENSPDFCVAFSDASSKYDCEEMFEDDGYLFVTGSSSKSGVRREIVWILELADLNEVDSEINTASTGNLLMGCIAQINSEYFVTCGENYSGSLRDGPNNLAITLWGWDSSNEELSVVNERIYFFTDYNREGAFVVLIVENSWGDPIGLYVFCEAEQSTGQNSNGILVAYVKLQNMSSNPSLSATAQNCLFMEPDASYGLTDGYEVGGSSVDYVTVDGEIVAVCLSSPVVVSDGPYLSRNSIWISTVEGLDDPPIKCSDPSGYCDSQLLVSSDTWLLPTISAVCNPSFVVVKLSYENASEILLYDISGREVWSSACAADKGILEISCSDGGLNHLTPGVYYAVAHSHNETSPICELLILE